MDESAMAKRDYPKTNAIRCLLKHGVPFEVFTYPYEDKGGTHVSSRELGVDEHAVVKTLVMETSAKDPLIVLMHGDREVSTKQLARLLKVKSVPTFYLPYMVHVFSPVDRHKHLLL